MISVEEEIRYARLIDVKVNIYNLIFSLHILRHDSNLSEVNLLDYLHYTKNKIR